MFKLIFYAKGINKFNKEYKQCLKYFTVCNMCYKRRIEDFNKQNIKNRSTYNKNNKILYIKIYFVNI